MTVALSIIKDALQEIGVIDGSETPSDDDSNKALRALNDLLDSWTLDNLTVAVQNNYTYTLVPGKFVYTIGPSPADFVGARLATISSAFSRFNSVDYPIELIDNQTYNDIPFKTQAGVYPWVMTVDQTMPAVTVTIYPVPTMANQITFLANVPFATPITLATDLIYPPGYNRALIKSLALELCPIFQITPPDMLVRLAASALGTIKRQNKRTPLLNYDDAMYDGLPNGTWNWLY